MQTKVRAIQRGTTSEVDLKGGAGGDLNVSQLLPPYAQLCAAGFVFAVDTSAGTALAPVTAMPTSTATWALYNANSGGGKSLVVIQVAVSQISGTAGLGAGLVGTITVGEQTAIAANYASTVVSCLDGTAKQPNAFLDDAITLVGTQSAWITLAADDRLAVVTVGGGFVADIDGKMIVPPHGIAGFDVLSPAGTTPLYDISIIFAEVQLDLA